MSEQNKAHIKPIDESKLSPIGRSRFAQLKRSITSINENIQKAGKVRKINEDFFIQSFLPFFAGEEKPEHLTEMRQLWLELAGDVFGEVELVDAFGVTKSIVPPLSNRGIIDFANPAQRESFQLVLTRAEAKAGVSSDASDTMLLNALNTTLASKENIEKSNKALEERWRVFLAQYGKGFVHEKNKPVSTSGSDALSDDDFI